MSTRLDPQRLHVITDVTLQTRFTHEELGRLALAGGADVVQYRDKRGGDYRDRLALARALVTTLAGGTRVVVNDHPEVARDADAAGVHLGHADVTPQRARSIVGDERLVGRTANDLAEAVAQADSGADYLGVGPVYGTRSKQRPAPTLGIAGLRRIVSAVGIPVIAIGGIRPENVADILAAGAHGVAVLSAVVCAEDPAAATAAFRTAIDSIVGRQHEQPHDIR
ncbi:MAG: thiamine phosphate synthase [bacterium]|nr:thiamine phosphate synthase [bacterium]